MACMRAVLSPSPCRGRLGVGASTAAALGIDPLDLVVRKQIAKLPKALGRLIKTKHSQNRGQTPTSVRLTQLYLFTNNNTHPSFTTEI